MQSTETTVIRDTPRVDVRDAALERVGQPPHSAKVCYHCGARCRDASLQRGEKAFCCRGCFTVFELLTENGLGAFYGFGESVGLRVDETSKHERFRYLDESEVREKLVDYSDAQLTQATFQLPAIHCIACVWLLENLFRLKSGVGQSQVNFPRKEVAISFETGRVKLSEVAALLASLGYEPDLRYSDLESRPKQRVTRRVWLQVGIAAFAFGNTMLFSIAGYFGLDAFSGPGFKKLVGLLSLALAIPVVTYSALDYWRSAWMSLRQRLLNIDVPIAAGIAALFAQSVYEVLSGRGDGYFDSLAGLLFFLLCGKLFQQKTYDRLAFDRDYKSFFPLSITRRVSGREKARASDSEIQNRKSEIEQSLPTAVATNLLEHDECVSLAQLSLGDRLVIRNRELIPADARLVEGAALIDYSFVTGESEPVEKNVRDYLYAGGRQIGSAIEVETVKPVSQSYLTSLWNREIFRKDKSASFETLINAYSYRFTLIVIAIAVGAAVFWSFRDPSKSLKAFTSVLIVACPCALALAAPFTLGTAIRALGRHNVFVKSTDVVEALAKVDAVVFDKTGTLTAAGAQSVTFVGPALGHNEQRWLYSLARHSTHPLSVRVAESLHADFTELVRSFAEETGCGIEGAVAGRRVLMGSAAWLDVRGVSEATQKPSAHASVVHVAIDGQYRGYFVLESALRSRVDEVLRNLLPDYQLTLLSGDNEKQRDKFLALFGETRFNQSPLDKLEFIHGLQRAGRRVMMVGDGLNDAGALKQSDVGAAVVENISAFSPASDVIMNAGMMSQVDAVLRFSKHAVRIVRLSFLLSSFYNVIGLSIAAAGLLSPIICAILMPLSSVSVVAFACGATAWAARRSFRGRANLGASRTKGGEPVSVR